MDPKADTLYGWGIMALLLLLTFCGSVGCKKSNPPQAPPPEVQVTTVTPTNVPIYGEWIGTLDGYVNAQIRAQVTGYLLTQNYAEGSQVKKGDLLFQIDPRPFEAALQEANAKLAQDEAQVEKTRLDVERFTPLARTQSISQQELDNAIQASVAAKAQVKADQAAIESSRLSLGFTKITSPIDGLAGVAQNQIGDLVGASSGVLTTVSTINPIKVYFQVNEQSYLTFWRRFATPESKVQSPESKAENGGESGATGSTAVAAASDIRHSSPPPLELILSDGSTYPEKGRFFFADRQVNPTTGTLQIVGLFSNADFLLRPGQYARVRAVTQVKTNAFIVPQRAISELQGSYQVSVVTPENKIHLQSVKVTDQIGANWLIEQGLKSGERVVVEGLQKAKQGEAVSPKPFLQQTNR